MTIKELKDALNEYDENLEVRIQYRDDGGCYFGTDEPNPDEWNVKEVGYTYKRKALII